MLKVECLGGLGVLGCRALAYQKGEGQMEENMGREMETTGLLRDMGICRVYGPEHVQFSKSFIVTFLVAFGIAAPARASDCPLWKLKV